MIVRRRVTWIVSGIILAAMLGIAAYVLSGSSAIESWVGSQILDIVGTYLGPELRFEHLKYVRPRTVVLENLTLSSPDPANPGHSVVILSVKRAELELTEIPRRGRPIKFSQIILDSPEIHAIAVTPGKAALVGFSHMLKDSSGSPTPAPSSAPSAAGSAHEPAPAPMKLSDLLLIRKVEITHGAASYDPRTPGESPIWLDGISARLDFTPAGASGNPGEYALATTISRTPAFTLAVQGKVNINTLTVALTKLELTLDLEEKNIHVLPPDLQKVLESAEVTGKLHLTASGSLPLTDWRQAALQSQGSLTAARMAWGQSRLSVDSWNWDVGLDQGVATIRKSDAHLLGGELHVTGTVPLNGTQPAHVALSADKLQIEKLLRSSNPGELPLYAGNVAAKLTFSAPLAKWNQQASGDGSFTIRQGRIDNLPVLGSIVAALNNVVGKSLAGNRHGLTDTADGSFTFVGNGARVDHLEGTAGALALRGDGTIGFDRRLDLRLNAGPMERLQNSLGAVGQAWASLSDAMAGYHVAGTIDNPQVSLEIGGQH